ncbi:hypothetical protein [Novosphingobium sp. FSW06-99]|uniref:hypothetical protein n=1 Tax=Novosphingobium sp. FSW06-99 TaxID=1739113 RepID=UPI00076C42D5|nr:hypothetical protein [Novosphingobium sp. FSW06-99]KUR80802.1 hypothetical protein AQZ49_01875 [Novosphingobium sp. FSW06-99]
MAGSFAHIVAEDGSFTMDTIDHMGDAHEALEDCHKLIAFLLPYAAMVLDCDSPDADCALAEAAHRLNLNVRYTPVLAKELNPKQSRNSAAQPADRDREVLGQAGPNASDDTPALPSLEEPQYADVKPIFDRLLAETTAKSASLNGRALLELVRYCRTIERKANEIEERVLMDAATAWATAREIIRILASQP